MILTAADMRARMVALPLTPGEWPARLQKAGAQTLADRLRPFVSRL